MSYRDILLKSNQRMIALRTTLGEEEHSTKKVLDELLATLIEEAEDLIEYEEELLLNLPGTFPWGLRSKTK